MFRILVADDEKVTRRGIVTMLERGLKEEIEFIEASNGTDALQIVKQQMIHLVITDICMPLCSGLEFVEQLRKNDDDMTVIIISGYENFEYAKQAVRLGVKDYIMKPLHREELLGLVENCIADIRKKQMDLQVRWQESQKKNQILKEVEIEALQQLLQGIHAETGIQRLKTMNPVMNESLLLAAVIMYEWSQETDELIDFAVKNIVEECLDAQYLGKYCSVANGQNQLTVVFGLSEMKQKLFIEKKLSEVVFCIEKYGRMKAIAGVGEFVFAPEELHKSYEQAHLAADCKIFHTGEKIITYSDIPRGTSNMTVGEIIDNHALYEEQKVLDRFQNLLIRGKSVSSIVALRKEYNHLLQHCNKLSRRNERYSGKQFSHLWSDFELRREIKALIQYSTNVSEDDVLKKRQIVMDIMAFTRQHVTEDIDLNYIAEIFGKTPGYIGSLFRKENQLGFNEFVTRERIKIAKNLLKDQTLSVQKVGEMCGYYNPKYFSIVFKKAEGVSPKSYQMMQKKGE